MKTGAPTSKSLVLFLVFVVQLGFAVPGFGQKRRASQKSAVSKAAGLVEEADKLAEDKKYPEAIDAYKLAIRLDANYAPAYGGLGDVYFTSGNSEQALAAYKEQVRLAPNDADAQYDLGYFYNAMGRHGEAFAPLVKATSLDPNFAEAFYGIGYAYLRGTEFDKSIGYLRSAIRLKPDYAEAYYGLGQAYAKLGKPDLANEQLKKLNTLDRKLAGKLEKEIAAGPSANNNSKVSESNQQGIAPSVATQSTPATPTRDISGPTQQSPIARKVDEVSATQSQQPKTTEPSSRQLQQEPPAQTQ